MKDTEVLARRLEPFHGSSYAWAVQCVRGDAEAAADVLQIAYVKVLDGRARPRHDGDLQSWFFGVVRNTAAGWRRATALRAQALYRWRWGLERPAAEPDDTASDAEKRAQRVRVLLGQLSKRQREVLSLVFFHDRTIEQAAAVLGIGVGSARTHYKRGKARLRDLFDALEQQEDEEPRRRSAGRSPVRSA